MFTSFIGRIGHGRSRVTRRPARLMLRALEERSTPAQLVVTSSADDGSSGTLRSASHPVSGEVQLSMPEFSRSSFDNRLEKLSNASRNDYDRQSHDSMFAPKYEPFGSQTSGAFVVDSLADTVDGDFGPGRFTLREAIYLANCDSAINAITFSSTLFSSPQTISLDGELSVSAPIYLDGPGAHLLTLSGRQLNRVMAFSGKFASHLIDLTIANGRSSNDGGAISCAQASLIVLNCRFLDNESAANGGAIAISQGVLTLTQSSFQNNNANNGGAVRFDQSSFISTAAIITNCEFMNNRAKTNGGAVGGFGRPEIRQSTFVNNSAGGLGGACYFVSLSLLTQCTISGNQAMQNGGGLFAGLLRLFNCTIAANSAQGSGGGIYSEVLSLGAFSSVVAGNVATTGNDVLSVSPSKIFGDNNLIGVADDGNITFTGINNVTGTFASPIDAKLASLVDNGGPTMTHALLPGSPCIDAGANPNNLAFDQRDFKRTVGLATDIGAYEAQAPRAIIHVNDGSAQRSMVTRFNVTFSEAVTFPTGIASAFMLSRSGPGGPNGLVNLAFTQTGNTVTVSFDDPIFAPQVGNTKSLIDGRYTLMLIAANIQGAFGVLDGDGDGIGGDDQFVKTHRLFGDANGDRTVNAVDVSVFRSAFGGSSFAFDFNGTGSVDTSDFTAFRLRFGSSV